ncbi:MAG: T9SS type A sorting domain-containing protein, partial [Ignavibacteriaceae bacterium]|nr:T9SS type A sorting domain-containing protein [Ignavibacteriaceae bacterium]
NEEKPAGEYEVEFDGRDLSSGVYFYQLRSGDFIQTNKMILLR